MKKALSILLVLCLVVSLFAGLASTVSAASYSYNTGKRGTVCTSLSSKAKSYYTGSYVYSTLSKQSGSTLKSNLKSLMTSTHKTIVTYEQLKTYTKYSDADAGSSSKIVDFYSSATYSGTWDSGNTWNREHVWCQSLGSFTTKNCGADLHHLRPTDPTLNSTRNNSPFGEVSGSYKTAKSKSGAVGGYYTSSYFEPLDNVKGDVARILLYCHVRWGESNITKLISSTTTLLDWMKADPVDTWEMGRNDVVQSIQGNRNVFIDYPEYAWLIYSKSIPSHTTPSGMAKGSSSSSGSTSCSHSSTTSSTTNATCTATGKTTKTCKSCGAVVSTTTIAALGHNYKYTSNSNGTHKVTCSRCTYSSSANCTYSSNTCKYCGYTKSTSSGSTGSTSSSVSAGQYVIAAKVGSTYYAMSNSFASKISATQITVSNGKISASAASGYVVTLAKSGSSYTISNGSKYLTYSSSSNFGSSTTAYKWNITAGTNGSYRITASGSSTRGILFYRSYTRFGPYAVSNATAGSSYYYDVELIPVSGSTSGSSSGSTNSGSSSSSSSSGTKSYQLVTSASGLTAGTYVIVASASGSYAGSYKYYALTNSKDGSYSAMSASGLSLSSLPTTLTSSASAAASYEWTLSGSRTSFKLAKGSNYLTAASGATKLTLSSSGTSWSATYTSSAKGFRVKGVSRYIAFRDDISTTGSNGLPLFCTVASTSTGTTYLHFYKLVSG